MGILKKTGGGHAVDGIPDMSSGVIPPGPGQTGHYLCRNCGERFTRRIPLFFGFPCRCPTCGSFRVVRDPVVVH